SNLKVRSEWVSNIAWSPDSRCIALAKGDSTAQVWNALTREHVLTYRGHSESVRDIAWSPDGRRLATASNDHTVQIWDSVSGRHIYTYYGLTKVTSLVWLTYGKIIYIVCNFMTIHIWQ